MWILYSMDSVDDNSKLLDSQSQIVAVTDNTYRTVPVLCNNVALKKKVLFFLKMSVANVFWGFYWG